MIWCHVVWCGVVWCDVLWCDTIRYDMIWYDMIWYDIYGVAWRGVAWRWRGVGVAWRGMAWRDMTWPARHDRTRQDTARHDTTRRDMTYWFGKYSELYVQPDPVFTFLVFDSTFSFARVVWICIDSRFSHGDEQIVHHEVLGIADSSSVSLGNHWGWRYDTGETAVALVTDKTDHVGLWWNT